MGKASRCEICGKFYKTYAIILCDNPLCFAHFLADEEKPDGTMRAICKKCRNKLEKEAKEIKKIEEQIDNALRISKETRDIYFDI